MVQLKESVNRFIMITFILINIYGIQEGGWYGNYTTTQSYDTYECSGVPGSTDC